LIVAPPPSFLELHRLDGHARFDALRALWAWYTMAMAVSEELLVFSFRHSCHEIVSLLTGTVVRAYW
jgi:hypothetical protein